MDTTNGNNGNTGAANLDETTFGAAEIGRSYLTSRGHEVLVIEVVPGSHAIVQSRKGKEMRVAADQVAHGPLPIVENKNAGPHDESSERDAGDTGDTPIEIAPKRKRDMTIDDLRAEYLRVIGRETNSTDRRYLLWKIGEASKGKVPVGPIQARTPREKADLQVLPLSMDRDTVGKLDAAWKALGFRSRMAFIRDCLHTKLVFEGSMEGADPAVAAAAEALTSEDPAA